MPPKSSSDTKAPLLSPNKGQSYAAAASSSIADRTRGAAGRRPSREGLESIATMADLTAYDSDGSSSSRAHSSSSSTSTSSSAVVDPEWQQIIQLLVNKVGVQSPAKVSSSANTPRVVAPSVPSSVPSVPPPGGVTLEPSVQRLVTAVAAGANGMPTIPIINGTITPGTVVNESNDDGDTSDDEKSAPAPSQNDLRWGHIYVPERDRWAPGAIRAVRTHYQTFQGRATVIRCKDIRNKHEVDTLSLIADAALAGRNDIVLEVVIRRLNGVEDADNGGGRDWDTATVLDLARPGLLGSDELRRRVRKDAAQLKANRKVAGTNNNGPSRTTAGTGGQWQKKNKKGGGGARPSGSSTPATKS